MLSKEDIIRGLKILSERAVLEHMTIDLAVYGGAALAIAYDLRQATKDVDAVVDNPHQKQWLTAVVSELAIENGWPEDWLNDGVKGFVSQNNDLVLHSEFNKLGPGIRVYVPVPEYLFAMKCMAMRLDDSKDRQDIESLAKIIGITSSEKAFELIEKFYPRQRMEAKVMFGVEEIMEDLNETYKPN